MAFVIPTVVELELAPSTWTNVSVDVLDGISAQYGITGGKPTDRVASTGTLRLRLMNGAWNAAGQSGKLGQGHYSPGHAQVVQGFDIGIGIRWRQDRVVARYFFTGRIASITVVPGRYGAQETLIEAVDWMDEAATQTLSGIPTQLAQRADQILVTALASVTLQPTATDFDTGDSTFAYALDNAQDESTRLLQALAAVIMSEAGYLYLLGDGTLVFESRTARALNVTSVATFIDTMHGLTVSRSRDDLVNVMQTTVHPRRVDAAATTILWSRDIADDEEPIEMAAGAVVDTIFGAYGDPANNRARCGGTDMQAPVSGTDYHMFANADGSGANLVANLTVTPAFGSNGVRWALTNGGAGTGYITRLRCLGKGIYDRAPVMVEIQDATSVTAFGRRLTQLDMAYQDDTNAAVGFTEAMIALYRTAGSYPRTLQVMTGPDAAVAAAILVVDVGSRITIVETVTGVSADVFVQGCAYTLEQGVMRATWTLAPADGFTSYWQLGTAGVSELDDTTVLGYG